MENFGDGIRRISSEREKAMGLEETLVCKFEDEEKGCELRVCF